MPINTLIEGDREDCISSVWLFFREMLELGCGTGHWTAFFSERGLQVTAVDPFRHAHLYTPAEIRNQLALVGIPQYHYAV